MPRAGPETATAAPFPGAWLQHPLPPKEKQSAGPEQLKALCSEAGVLRVFDDLCDGGTDHWDVLRDLPMFLLRIMSSSGLHRLRCPSVHEYPRHQVCQEADKCVTVLGAAVRHNSRWAIPVGPVCVGSLVFFVRFGIKKSPQKC